VSESNQSVTSASLQQWAQQALRDRLAIHFQRTDPVQAVRETAFTRMSDALLSAIGMVQVAATALHEMEQRLAKWEGDGARV
jgi:hypothetical protein